MEFSFEKLNVWQESAIFAADLLQETEKISNQIRPEIISNLKRATLEIPSFLAIGKSYYQGQDFLEWLNRAKESTFEVASLLKMSENLEIFKVSDSNNLLESANKIIAQITALSKSIENRIKNETS